MLLDPTILGLSAGGSLLLLLFLFLTGSSVISFVVVIALLATIVYLLNQTGIITITTENGDQVDIKFNESAIIPEPASQQLPLTDLHQKEVFYVSGNDYTYDDAPAVCAAYESELATYDQVMQAYSTGAEWCGYGWSAGGMALFPTQESTWESLMQEADQSKRTQCGRPGVNGGYFDPKTKFGVNCYGIKPKDKGTSFPVAPPGTDPSLLNKFKSMVNRMDVAPFNRTSWSEWNLKPHM